MTYQVGQKLWVVGRDSTNGYTVEVTKIGRRWVEIGAKRYGRVKRFDPVTNLVDAGEYTPRERVYASKEAYDARMALQARWDVFRAAVKYQVPVDATVESIEAAAQLLGLKLS